MLNDQRFVFAGRLPLRLKWIVLGWLAAEIVVLLALVKLMGFGNVVLLGLATTVLGIVTLRRIGTGALLHLRQTVDGGQPPAGALAEGMLAGLGGVLLVLPGFLANFIGLALAAPSIRRKALALFNGEALPPDGRLRRGPRDVIDLTPGEWRPVDRP